MSGPDTRSDIEKGGNGDRDPITPLANSLVELFKEGTERAVQIHLDSTHPDMPGLLDELYGYGVFSGSEPILVGPMPFHYEKALPPTDSLHKLSLITPTLPPKPANVSIVVSAGRQPAICFRLVSIQRIESSSQLVYVQMLGVSTLPGAEALVFRSIECKRVYAGQRGSIVETIVQGDFRETITLEKSEVICALARSAIQRMADI